MRLTIDYSILYGLPSSHAMKLTMAMAHPRACIQRHAQDRKQKICLEWPKLVMYFPAPTSLVQPDSRRKVRVYLVPIYDLIPRSHSHPNKYFPSLQSRQ